MNGLEMKDEKRLIVSPRAFIESQEAGHVVVFERESSQRIRIGRALYDLLMKFEAPASVPEICAAHQLSADARKALDRLVAKRFLVDADAPFEARRKPLTKNPYTLFNCPRCHGDGCESDVSVIGVPHDLGSQVAAGTRNGPQMLRLRSNEFDYRVNFKTGAPTGWFDVDAGQRTLEGVRFCDRGDLWFAYGEAPNDIAARLETLCHSGHGRSLPLFVGGDHSITYSIVKAVQEHQPVVVLWFDAHSDMGHFIPPASHNHFSVARRVLSLPQVEKMIHVGYRGYTMKDEINTGDPRRAVITARNLSRFGAGLILEQIPEGAACYLSMDLDVVDPSYAPAVSSPSSGGLNPEELREVLFAIGKARRFVGMDLVEFNPDMEGMNRSANVVCQLLMAALGGMMSYEAHECDLDAMALAAG
jgi:agmatinase